MNRSYHTDSREKRICKYYQPDTVLKHLILNRAPPGYHVVMISSLPPHTRAWPLNNDLCVVLVPPQIEAQLSTYIPMRKINPDTHCIVQREGDPANNQASKPAARLKGCKSSHLSKRQETRGTVHSPYRQGHFGCLHLVLIVLGARPKICGSDVKNTHSCSKIQWTRQSI